MSVIQTLQEKYKSAIWVAGNGELIPLSIMTNARLWNCYKSVEKQLHEHINISTFLKPNGDAAIDTIGYYDPDDELVARRLFLLAWKEKLTDELERRGLTVSS